MIDQDLKYLSKEELKKLSECYFKVMSHYHGNEQQVSQWFNTDNPILNDLAPIDLVKAGKVDKLLRFVRGCVND